jgi:hypothetical protein
MTQSPYLHFIAGLRRQAVAPVSVNPGTLLAGAAQAAPPPPNVDGLVNAAFGAGPDTPQFADLRARTLAALSYFGLVGVASPRALFGAHRPPGVRQGDGRLFLSAETKANLPDNPCVMAILDDSIPYVDPVITSRIASLWVQNCKTRLGNPDYLPFGCEISGKVMQRIKDSTVATSGFTGNDAIYEAMSRPEFGAPARLRSLERFSHGAAVLGEFLADATASGKQNFLVGVSLPPEVVRDTSGALLPYFAICGLLHVIAVTRRLGAALAPVGAAPPDLPIVVNFSFGVLAGAKDGRGPFEYLLNALGDPNLRIPGVGPLHIVVPMGNGRQSQSFATLGKEGAPAELGLKLLPDDRTPSFVEVWQDEDGDDPFRIALCPPYGTGYQEITGVPNGPPVPLEGCPDALAYTETIGGRGRIVLAFPPTAPEGLGAARCPPGTWKFRLPADSAPVTLAVQRDDSLDGLGSGGRQARFVHPAYSLTGPNGRPHEVDPSELPACPVTRAGTVNALAAGPNLWRVGGRFATQPIHRGAGTTVPYSGLMRDGGTGDLTEVSDQSPVRLGERVRSQAGGAMTRASGTSIAAPRIAVKIAKAISAGTDPRNRDALTDAVDALPTTGTFALREW